MKKQYKLKKEFAENWIKALRSGKYKQGDGYLFHKETNSYCCLGVACKITMPRAKIELIHFIDGDIVSHKLYNKMPALLRGTDEDNHFVEEVSFMNDNGTSFIEISNWIVQNVEFV